MHIQQPHFSFLYFFIFNLLNEPVNADVAVLALQCDPVNNIQASFPARFYFCNNKKLQAKTKINLQCAHYKQISADRYFLAQVERTLFSQK